MNNEQMKTMDPMILVSIVNMKLRDFYEDLDSMCDDMNLDKEVLISRLEAIDFKYVKEVNSFK